MTSSKAVRLRVVAVSSNHNGFGLRNMVMIGDNRQGWRALANDLRVKKKGDTITVLPNEDGRITDGVILNHLTAMGLEDPYRLQPDPSADVVRDAFAS